MKKIALLAIVLSFIGCTKKSTDAVPGKITGVITVSKELAGKLKPTDVLFIIARAQQVGPPSAVKRIPNPKFPLNYMIGSEDAMMPGIPGFESGANITLVARLSRSGDAMPAAGDLEGVFPKNPAHPGDGGVDVVIDKER